MRETTNKRKEKERLILDTINQSSTNRNEQDRVTHLCKKKIDITVHIGMKLLQKLTDNLLQ